MKHLLTQDGQLCFIHIAKTAGTTLTSIIDANFSVDDISPEPDYLEEHYSENGASANHENLIQLLKHYRFIRGHFAYSFIHPLLPETTLYMTMLRHPVERFLSFYEFLKRDRERGEPKRRIDLQLLRNATADGLLNFIGNPDPMIKAKLCNRQMHQLTSYAADTSNLSERDLLQLAKQNLEKFSFVGLTERFQDSVLLMSYRFGWYPNNSYQSLRVAQDRAHQDGLDQKIIDMILECNQLDSELYEYAQTLFDTRFSAMLQELKQQYSLTEHTDLSQPSTLLDILEKDYERRCRALQIEPVEVLNFDFCQPIRGVGWHRRNGSFNGLKSKGSTFRWTGPGTESTLDFCLSTEIDLAIRIYIVNASTAALDSFKLKVNNHPTALEPIIRRGKSVIFEGTIPRAALINDKCFTRLTFNVDRTVPLQDIHSNSSDKRLVGVAIQSIQIFPATVRPKILPFTTCLFPDQDSCYIEAANFIAQHLKPGERVAAPLEFSERFPDCFYSYSSPFANKPLLSWVIVHKGYLQEIEYSSLEWAIENLNVVFANEVFVLFVTHKELKKVHYFANHLRPFWRSWLDLQGQRGKRNWFFFLRKITQV
jgi:Sulfotransferase family